MTITPQELDVGVGRGARFILTMLTGSDVSLDVNYEDGTTSMYFFPGRVRTRIFSHVFDSSGVYTVTLSCSNALSVSNTHTVINVHLVLNETALTICGDLYIAVPFEKEATGKVFLACNGTQITGFATQSLWKVEENEASLADVILPGTEMLLYCDSDESFNITVVATNIISEGTVSGTVQCVQQIHDVVFEVSSIGYSVVYNQTISMATVPVGVPVTFAVSTAWGSHLTYTWTAHNSLVWWENASSVFTYTFLHDNSWLTVRLENVINALQSELAIKTMNVVAIESFRPKHNIVPGKMATFSLRLRHHRTRPCFKFDPGDGAAFYHGFGCESNLSPIINATLSGLMLFFDYSYQATGWYTFKIEAWNAVSQDVISVNIPVNSEPCSSPFITIQGIGTLTDQPRIEYSSSVIRITSFTMISCQLTNQVNFVWYESTDGILQLLTSSKTSEITFPERFFKTGIHEIMVHASMASTFVEHSEDSIFLHIVKSPLAVHVAGGEARNVGWDRMLTLDGWSLTFDPDVVSNISREGIVFTWYCQYASGFGLGSSRTISPGKDVLIENDTSGCFTGASTLENSQSGILSLNTMHLKLDAVYSFRVEALKGGRIGSDRQDVMIVTGDPPTVQIR